MELFWVQIVVSGERTLQFPNVFSDVLGLVSNYSLLNLLSDVQMYAEGRQSAMYLIVFVSVPSGWGRDSALLVVTVLRLFRTGHESDLEDLDCESLKKTSMASARNALLVLNVVQESEWEG